MKAYLINPKTNMDYGLGYRLFNSLSVPLSLAYIAAALEEAGIEVVVRDQYADRSPNQLIINEILREKPQLVGFSCLANTLGTVKQISAGIKKSYRPKIIAGNINASVFAKELLQERIVDIVVRGEGEYAIQEIASRIRDNGTFADIKGISYLSDDALVHNPDRPPIEDIDKLPYPAFHLFDLDGYKDQLFFLQKGRILPVSVSRGCDHSCLFCSNRIIHRSFRVRAPKKIAEEMAFLHARYQVNTFGLVGSYFPVNDVHAEEFCAALIRTGLHKKIKWFTESRVDRVSPGLLKRMKEAGLYFIMYGCDFGTQRMLDRVNKGTTCEQAEAAVRAAKALGITTVSYFLLGGPGETEDECKETISFSRRIDSDIAKFNITVPYPGSPLFEQYRRRSAVSYEKIDEMASWEDWAVEEAGGFREKISTLPGLVRLQRMAMFKFYFRPKVLTRMRLLRYKDFSFRYLLAGIFVMFGILWKTMDSGFQNYCKKFRLG